MQLVNYGKLIIEKRKKFIEELNEIIKQVHTKLTNGKEQIELLYEPDVSVENFEKGLLYETTSFSRVPELFHS